MHHGKTNRLHFVLSSAIAYRITVLTYSEKHSTNCDEINELEYAVEGTRREQLYATGQPVCAIQAIHNRTSNNRRTLSFDRCFPVLGLRY